MEEMAHQEEMVQLVPLVREVHLVQVDLGEILDQVEELAQQVKEVRLVQEETLVLQDRVVEMEIVVILARVELLE